MKKLLLLILLASAPAFAQGTGAALIVLFPGAPTGTCNPRELAINTSNGALYTCANGAWVAAGGWNPPNNAPGSTLFGNNSVATGTPSFFQAAGDLSFGGGTFSVNQLHFGPNILALTNTGIATGNCLTVSGASVIGGPCGTGGGGGTGLLGCATATSGNLACDVSVAAGTGSEGVLALNYSTLPSPPTTPSLGQLAANPAGLWWSPGGSTDFSRLAYASEIPTITQGPATALQFGGIIQNLGTAPINGQCLVYDGTSVTGGMCGGGAMGGVTIVQ